MVCLDKIGIVSPEGVRCSLHIDCELVSPSGPGANLNNPPSTYTYERCSGFGQLTNAISVLCLQTSVMSQCLSCKAKRCVGVSMEQISVASGSKSTRFWHHLSHTIRLLKLITRRIAGNWDGP